MFSPTHFGNLHGLTPQPLQPATGVMGTPPCPPDMLAPPTPKQLPEIHEFDPIPNQATSIPAVPSVNPRTITTHQLKGVSTFSGRDKNIRVEDWVRDMTYLLGAKGLATDGVKFQEILRHTSGRARDVILNLEGRSLAGVTAEEAFQELLEEFGEDGFVTSPMTRFYSREQKAGETASEFAVALETLLRRIEERGRQQGRRSLFGDSRDVLLTTQFMAGLRDGRTKQRLAPMQPRRMSYRDLRAELRVIAEEQHHSDEQTRRRMRGDDDHHFYTMSEVATKDPIKPITAASSPAQQGPKSKSSSESTRKMQGGTDLQDLITKQLEEMQAMRLEQRETLQQVQKDQSLLNHRLTQLEEAVFAPQVHQRYHQSGQPQQRPQFSGCYTCGSKQHLARSCPENQRQAHQQAPQMKSFIPRQAASTPVHHSGSLNGNNPRM